jgi:hypothetical protein
MLSRRRVTFDRTPAMSLIIMPGESPDARPGRWELTAVKPYGLFDETNTRPLLVDARRGAVERAAWVLKPVCRLTPAESIKELVACRLATLCGIPVPPFGVVYVAEELARALPEPYRSTLIASLGPNFGTRFKAGYGDLADTLAVPATLRPLACDIFAFDVGLDNADRRPGNPNLLLGDDEILAIDHQHAFSWCVPGSHGPDEWDARILHRLKPNHFFGDVVFRWLSSYTRLRGAGTGMDEQTAVGLTEDLPEEWLARGGESYRDRIREYLKSLFAVWNDMLDSIEGEAAA